MFMI